jgi:hypothetical protein
VVSPSFGLLWRGSTGFLFQTRILVLARMAFKESSSCGFNHPDTVDWKNLQSIQNQASYTQLVSNSKGKQQVDWRILSTGEIRESK